MNSARIEQAFQTALGRLLQEMNPAGFWEGKLSSSALSTATAVSALCVAEAPGDAAAISSGVFWLTKTQNADGGWGDTPDSPSNLSTTMLVTAALTLVGTDIESAQLMQRAQSYITSAAGATPAERIAAIERIYGSDRTFAVPILVNCALARIAPWEAIPGLPFELAVFPQRLYKLLRLHVVSYALPALIAIGLAITTTRRHVRRSVA